MDETQNITKLNGYTIKDSEARSDISTLNSSVSALNSSVTSLNSEIAKFNLSNFEDLTFVPTHDGTIVGQTFKIAYDNSHSICKIYGRFVYNTSGKSFTSETITATLPFTLSDSITINPAGSRFTYNLAIDNLIGVYGVTYNLSGNTLSITFNNDPSTEGRHSIECPPCVYFLKDFGDVDE